LEMECMNQKIQRVRRISLIILCWVTSHALYAVEISNSTKTDEQSNNAAKVAPAAPVVTENTSKPLIPQPAPVLDGAPAKAQVCSACHGLDGNSPAPAWPKIAGQPEKYLIEQLKDYRKGQAGNRYDPSMYPMAAGLTDQDIAELAAFYAGQKNTPGTSTADNIALGERLFRGGNAATGVPACSACHDPRGDGNNPAGFPRLSGQYAAYTIDQLKKFKSGARKNGPNGIMRDIAQKMTEQEMEAVSNYVSGLH
jgi:cytochrome c553